MEAVRLQRVDGLGGAGVGRDVVEGCSLYPQREDNWCSLSELAVFEGSLSIINTIFVLLFSSQSSQPATKMRLFSTLDPELMLNPETLPRASAVAMTKEYSFLRTSVPRGPKVGSLGLLAHPKEKKSSKSGKIRSLADYRTEDSDTRNSGGNVPAVDSARGSLKQNRSSATSVVSEIRLCPEADDRLENTSLPGDNASEADGNESDSSSYSSVSTRGTLGLLANTVGTREASYVVNGQEIAAGALGHFPSITDVLQAAAAEHQDQGQEVNGEMRSRTDSICSRWVMSTDPALSLELVIHCFSPLIPSLVFSILFVHNSLAL